MASDQQPKSARRSPTTDSPWFWVCLFCGFGLALLVVVGPKYADRQQQIERKYHMQQHVYYGEAATDRMATGAKLTETDPKNQAVLDLDQPLIITLRPLLITFAVIFSAGWIGMWFCGRRQSNGPTTDHLPTASTDQESP